MIVTTGSLWWVVLLEEVRDAAKHPTVYSKAITIKNYSAQNVNSWSLTNSRKHRLEVMPLRNKLIISDRT